MNGYYFDKKLNYVYRDTQSPPHSETNLHGHNVCELLFLESGDCELVLEGKRQMLFSGALVILPRGTGYISDIGCTAPSGGIMGVRTDVICHRFRTKTPMPYKPAEGPVVAEGILLDMDEATNRCRSITRVKV